MIGAIESAVVSALMKGTEANLASEAMPELVRIASCAYFGDGLDGSS